MFSVLVVAATVLYVVFGYVFARASWRAWQESGAPKKKMRWSSRDDTGDMEFFFPLTHTLRDDWPSMPRPPVALFRDLQPGPDVSGAYLMFTYAVFPLRLGYLLACYIVFLCMPVILTFVIIFSIAIFGPAALVRWAYRQVIPA